MIVNDSGISRIELKYWKPSGFRNIGVYIYIQWTVKWIVNDDGRPGSGIFQVEWNSIPNIFSGYHYDGMWMLGIYHYHLILGIVNELVISWDK